MELLLHACCGPCACFPTEVLAEAGVKFDIFWYNPNIHPYREYKHRLATLREFCTKCGYSLLIDKDYALEAVLRAMLAEPVVRCAACYRVRLRRAAAYAAAHGYDAFSSTLLVSPYQKHDLIRAAAEAAAAEFSIPFYYQDWRSGYEQGVKRSLALGLYRQPYCGCVFSERDRYLVQKPVLENGGLVRVTKNIAIVNEKMEVPS